MFFMEMDIVHYLMYFGASVLMLAVFAVIYVVLTPYDDMAMIRKGQGAAAIGLSGTLVGFSLTLAASAIYNDSILEFFAWAVVSMIVQLLGYSVVITIIGNVNKHMEHNNVAVGSLIGLMGLVLGIINAGALS